MSSRTRAQAHAKHAHYCTCGKTVHGNGARAQHRAMHARLADGHKYMTYTEYLRRQEGTHGKQAEKVGSGSDGRDR